MFLLIDKPKDVTSHDVVDVIRRVTGEKKVGHAGTLDPNATGLLIIGVGRQSTKKLGRLSKETKKAYEAEIFLGEERDTFDSEGKIIRSYSSSQKTEDKKDVPSLSKVKKIVKKFIGPQKQIPPIYSAVKVKGKKAYELARKGEKVKLLPRKVTVYSIKLLSYNYPVLKINCTVSSGTYIRSLARDIGRALTCGAYLKNLRRTQIDGYLLRNSVKLGDITTKNWQSYAIELE